MAMRALAIAAAIGAMFAAPAYAQDYHPVDPDNLLVLDTSRGRVIVELRPDIAPNQVARLKALVRKGFYDDDVFYRVLPNFVVQTGAKTPDGSGASGLGPIKAELSFRPATPVQVLALGAGFSGDMAVAMDIDGTAWPKFCSGVASLAHYDDPNTGDAQIFMVTGPAFNLERTFTAWGRVVAGLDVLKTITAGEPPPSPDHLTKARIASDMPEAERPKVAIADPASPAFKAAIDKAKATGGGFLNVCDVVVPVEVK